MIKRLKSLFAKKSNIEQTDGTNTWEMQHIYTDTLGNKWYQPIDIEMLPSKRYAALEVKKSYLEIGVDEFTFKAAFKIAKELMKQGDTDNVAKLLDALEDRLSFDFNSRNILDMAVTLFTINDEKIYQFNEYYDELKKEALMKDADAKSFFLTISFELATKLTAKYDQYLNSTIGDLLLKEKQLNSYFGNIMHKIKLMSTMGSTTN
jgi:hypothetical protein